MAWLPFLSLSLFLAEQQYLLPEAPRRNIKITHYESALFGISFRNLGAEQEGRGGIRDLI